MQQSKITNKRADLLLNNVRQLVQNGIRANLDLCRMLHESFVTVTPKGSNWQFAWEYWGYKSWFDFVEIEMGMHELTANTCKKVWQVFGVELNGAWSIHDALPITKMKILAASDKLSKQNVASWLKKAKKMTCCDLQHEIYGESSYRTFSVTLANPEYRMLNRLIEAARKEHGEEKTKGELLIELLRPLYALRKAS